VAIFGRQTERQRLRTAAQESLTIPTFGSAVDCTPWVIGGLWPAELSTPNAQTSGLADYLKSDLQRITRRANNELTSIKRARMPDLARRAHEARVITEARTCALRRIESTLRQQQRRHPPHLPSNCAKRAARTDLDNTHVIAAITDPPPTPTPPAANPAGSDSTGGRHRAPDVD
jgi:hypothetical protein